MAASHRSQRARDTAQSSSVEDSSRLCPSCGRLVHAGRTCPYCSSLLPRPEFYRRDSCFEATALRRSPDLCRFQEHKIIRSRLVERDDFGEEYTSRLGDERRGASAPPDHRALRVMASTWNVGNRRVNDQEMAKWLSKSEGCDVVAIALQEANYLSSSQKRGLAMIAGFTVLGAAGPFGIGAGLAVGGMTAGAMALHSHVMPKLRRAIHNRNGRPKRPNERDDDEEDDQEEEDHDDGRGSEHRSGESSDEEVLGATRKGSEGTPMLSSAITAAIDRQLLPRGFERAVLVSHGQMRLAVYTRREPRDAAHSATSVDSFASSKSSSGKHGMGMAMNKGGLVARVSASRGRGALDLAFVAAHLPAHEGKRIERRDALREITDAFATETHGADCVFLLGDLNSRLARADDAPVDFEFASSLVLANRLAPLHDHDELIRELEGLEPAPALRAFATPSCDFAPTFKFVRKERGLKYNDKRCPAWCDRVLFKTKPRIQLDVLSYLAFPHVLSSDHKPVVLLAAMSRVPGHRPAPDILTGNLLPSEDSVGPPRRRASTPPPTFTPLRDFVGSAGHRPERRAKSPHPAHHNRLT